MLNRSKLFAVILLIATFLAGAVVGTAVSAAWAGGDRAGKQPRGRMSYTQLLVHELGLSPQQREAVSLILERRQQAMRDIWREVQPKFDTLRAQIRRDILAQLDSAQGERFRDFIARSESLRAAHERKREENRDGK